MILRLPEGKQHSRRPRCVDKLSPSQNDRVLDRIVAAWGNCWTTAKALLQLALYRRIWADLGNHFRLVKARRRSVALRPLSVVPKTWQTRDLILQQAEGDDIRALHQRQLWPSDTMPDHLRTEADGPSCSEPCLTLWSITLSLMIYHVNIMIYHVQPYDLPRLTLWSTYFPTLQK